MISRDLIHRRLAKCLSVQYQALKRKLGGPIRIAPEKRLKFAARCRLRIASFLTDVMPNPIQIGFRYLFGSQLALNLLHEVAYRVLEFTRTHNRANIAQIAVVCVRPLGGRLSD